MKIKDLTQLEHVELEGPDENGRNIRFYTFSGVTMTGHSSCYPDVLLKARQDEYLVLPILEMSMSLQKKSHYEEHGMHYEEHGMHYEYIDSSNDVEVIDKVYFFIYNTDNYYHFIYDTLPYLHTYLRLRKVYPNLKLVMNYNATRTSLLPFVKESLELLDIQESDIIIHQPHNVYRTMYVGNSLTHDGLSQQPPRKEIFDVYQTMVANAFSRGGQKVEGHEKIYISRRTWLNPNVTDNIGTNYTTRRRLMNEDDLVETLERKGFTECFGENYSMIEKILLFHRARVVVGAIGGTITNCVFCGDVCKIITLVSPEFLEVNSRMRFLFGDCVVLFRDTHLDCKEGELAPNIRIEITDIHLDECGRIGEIQTKDTNGYIIRLGTNYVGFREADTYETICLEVSQFKLLDRGINSPWRVDVERLSRVLSRVLSSTL